MTRTASISPQSPPFFNTIETRLGVLGGAAAFVARSYSGDPALGFESVKLALLSATGLGLGIASSARSYKPAIKAAVISVVSAMALNALSALFYAEN
jgi:hypothetical protein